MRKIFLATAGLVIFSLALGLPLAVIAAELTFNGDVTLSLPNGNSLTIKSGSTAESIVVNDDSTISLVLGTDSNITFESSQHVTVSPAIASDFCNGNVSTLNIISSSSQTVTVSLGSQCVSTPSGGGGGGGGATTIVVPTNTSVSINSGDTKTESKNVTLTLKATNAATMLIANKADFSGTGSWQNYATSTAWTLTEALGAKTVYVKFRSSAGGESAAVTDSLEVVAPTQPSSADITSTSGGTVTSSDSKLMVNVPAGAINANGAVSVAPTATFTAPGGNYKVIGSKVYDLSVTVNSSLISAFNELITLTFSYSDADVLGVNESTLTVKYWSEMNQEWSDLGGTVNAAENKITVATAHFTKFAVVGQKTAGTGNLVKKASSPAVFYLGSDNKLHVFTSSADYFTWYSAFSGIETISDSEFASYRFGENVFPKPGVKLVQAVDGETPWNIVNSKVYAVSGNGVLRYVSSAQIAEGLFGTSWESKIIPVVISVFSQYTMGDDINSVAGYDKQAELDSALDINTVKGL